MIHDIELRRVTNGNAFEFGIIQFRLLIEIDDYTEWKNVPDELVSEREYRELKEGYL